MKTRILKTDIYTDETMLSLTPDVRFICVYLYTNSHISLTNIYKIPVQLIQLETGYDISVIRLAIDKLTEVKAVVHYKHLWVKLLREDFGALVFSGGKNDIAVEKYESSIPNEIKDFFLTDTSIDSSIHTTYKSETINHKQEVRSQKSEVDPDFEEFYRQYPPRRKAGKKAPYSLWLKLSPEEKTEVLADLPVRVANHADWLKDDGQFIPAPEVFLRNEKWKQPIIAKKSGIIKIS